MNSLDTSDEDNGAKQVQILLVIVTRQAQVENLDKISDDSETSEYSLDTSNMCLIYNEKVNMTDLLGLENGLDLDSSSIGTTLKNPPDLTDVEISSDSDSTSIEDTDSEN